MKVQYGDKFKIIPKKYGDIKDIGKHFMSDKLRLLPEERTLLEKILNKGIYSFVFNEWKKNLTAPVREYIGELHVTSICKILRRTEPDYYSVVFENRKEVRCEEALYKKAINAGIKTEKFVRSF